jgi:hypothetical protein
MRVFASTRARNFMTGLKNQGIGAWTFDSMVMGCNMITFYALDFQNENLRNLLYKGHTYTWWSGPLKEKPIL